MDDIESCMRVYSKKLKGGGYLRRASAVCRGGVVYLRDVEDAMGSASITNGVAAAAAGPWAVTAGGDGTGSWHRA